MRELPSGWRSVRLGETGTWASGGTPATDEPSFWGGEIPWISAASLKEFQISDSERRITERGVHAGTRIASPGSVLFVVRGMSLKSELRVGVAQREVAFGQDCKAIIPRQDIDGTFLALAIKAREQKTLSMVDEAGHGTGRLPTDLISQLRITVPPLAEQRRVAEVLDTLDDKIKLTERVIQKAEDLRHGLADRLLEECVGTQMRLEDVAEHEPGSTAIGPFGSNLVAGDYRSKGVPVIFVRDIRETGFHWISGVYVSSTKARELRVHDVRAGDLLLTKMGLPPCVAAVYPHNMPDGIITADVLRIRLNPDLVDVAWLGYALNHERFCRQVRAITGGVTRPKVTLADVRRLVVDLPTLETQKRIVTIIKTATDCWSSSISTYEGLLKLKQGLMEDLLTGRVRVGEYESAL